MDFLIFCLATIGMSHIIVESEILKPFREAVRNTFGEFSKITYMVACYQCIGVWSGVFLSTIYQLCYWTTTGLTGYPIIVDQFFCGCIGAFLSMLGAALINYLDVTR